MYELFLNVVWVFGIFFIVDVWRFVETHGRASVREMWVRIRRDARPCVCTREWKR